MNRRSNKPYVVRNKIVKIAESPAENPILNENLLEDHTNTGSVNVSVHTALGALPVPNAVVTLYGMDQAGNEEALYHLITNVSGKVPLMNLPVVFNAQDPLESSEYFFTTYNLRVQAIGYYTHNVVDVRVFPDTTTNYNITLVPVRHGGDEDENPRTIVIPSSPIDNSNI